LTQHPVSRIRSVLQRQQIGSGRRAERTVQDTSKYAYAIADFAGELLAVADNLQRTVGR
jgi:molecular chaperone GrpE (heat shock protein)